VKDSFKQHSEKECGGNSIMTSRKEDPKDSETQTGPFSLDESLKSLDAESLHKLIWHLQETGPGVRRLILEWLKENPHGREEADLKKDRVHLNDELLMEYWENARAIISEFNEYGGGSDEEESEVWDWLKRISELIKEGGLSTDAKCDFLDFTFEEYDIGNSGFEDDLKDIFFQICEAREEWEYLIEKLSIHPTRWRKKLVMDIQKKHLCDEEAYLETRFSSLHYGGDYWDLVSFYVKRKDKQRALEIAEEGIAKGEGGLTDLFRFLFDHYVQKGDSRNLERIVNIGLTRESDRSYLLDRLFEYYKGQNKYEKAKEYLLRSYDLLRYDGYYSMYKIMNGFLTEDDWKPIEERVLRDSFENDIKSYLRICLDKNMKKTVLDVITGRLKNRSGLFVLIGTFDEFAEALKKDFPKEIIEYHWKNAYNNIPKGNRKTYRIAVKYLAKVKHIYIRILKDEATWNECLSRLKREFKNRPAFLEEVEEL